ncbi:MAG: lipid-binding SYLF domain-containing protein [Gammaproteobacteria bacterium]|nr:lipid-binding SYLF domain-containing protein [Gammaproteobacteria bacterium]
MKQNISATILALILSLFLTPFASADTAEGEESVGADVFEPGKWTEKAVTMLDEQMNQSPDKRIPKGLLQKAKCVALFPEVLQGGLGIGGKFGRGLVSCRHENGDWGVPVFTRLTSLTFGAQIGAQSVDVLMLIMNDKGLTTLLGGKPIVGAEAGIAAGPVGREGSANLDVFLQTPIVSYSRSKGLFAGAILEGAAITRAKKTNHDLYGDYENTEELLFKRTEAPESVQMIRDALAKYSQS